MAILKRETGNKRGGGEGLMLEGQRFHNESRNRFSFIDKAQPSISACHTGSCKFTAFGILRICHQLVHTLLVR